MIKKFDNGRNIETLEFNGSNIEEVKKFATNNFLEETREICCKIGNCNGYIKCYLDKGMIISRISNVTFKVYANKQAFDIFSKIIKLESGTFAIFRNGIIGFIVTDIEGMDFAIFGKSGVLITSMSYDDDLKFKGDNRDFDIIEIDRGSWKDGMGCIENFEKIDTLWERNELE